LNRTEQRWRCFWEQHNTPLHRRDDDTFYRPYARELQLLYEDLHPARVLEIGCGNGALYAHLGFSEVDVYRGVDFSSAMLREFQRLHPGVDTVCALGHSYEDASRYDLIFSNGVVQYFNPQMVAEHIAKAAGMLAPGGRIICASVPLKYSRWAFWRGRLGGPPPLSFPKFLVSVARKLFKDNMGFWYAPTTFERLAQEHGLTSRVYGSMHYIYRFHVVLTCKGC
jgi:cyclopropane fatty-acyl-phospholipid synthase-like methyltransferase